MGVGIAAGMGTHYVATQTGVGKDLNKGAAKLSRWGGMTNLSDEEYASKGSATMGGLAAGGPMGAAAAATAWDLKNAASTGKISNELLGIPFADKFMNTNVNSIFDTVICTELRRQGEITDREKTLCTVFRFRHIPTDMFVAYLEWAAPIVALMKKGGVANMLLLPFCKAFVAYMVAVQTGKKPTFAQRIVWKWAWFRCTQIAHKHNAMAMEVAA
jgi:hypothetical protein